MDSRSAIRFFYDHELPPDAGVVRILGVDYVHLKTSDDGDLFLTRFGFPFIEQLKPWGWYGEEWFAANREKLAGTSTVYKVKTRPVNNRSLDIVVKWCRVGEEVPRDTMSFTRFADAEFNSPFEEFSLVMELRNRRARRLIRTHKPLAIYVPRERRELWQTGRSLSKMEHKKAKFRDVELDVFRQYILIYEWIKGRAVHEALELAGVPEEERKRLGIELTLKSVKDLKGEGFRVLDIKPAHVIVRAAPDGRLLTRQNGETAYALVDFELLVRTPDYDEFIKAERRAEYFRRQAGRFFTLHLADLPPHLHHINIFGVDYIYGCTESTLGVVWVVGNDPGLFDYFLPERWRRTQRTQLSTTRQVFATRTKDNIHLVWKVSRVGEAPDVPEAKAHGYNSPFEEVAFAVELAQRGLKTIFPRAVYMTGNRSQTSYVTDFSRHWNHENILMEDGRSVMLMNHNYITLWGYWSGPATGDSEIAHDMGINLQQAFSDGLIGKDVFEKLLERKQKNLAKAGFEDLHMKGEHLLMSRRADGSFILKEDGLPEVRICNFELMRRIQ